VRPAPQREPERVDSETVARLMAEIADAKKAEDVGVLDMRSLVSYTDFLVVCTARNERQAKAIQDDVHLRLKRDYGWLPANVEGEGEGGWILMDYLDCVLHVFVPETRERYRLDVLWAEAPRLELELADVRDSA
jgi:ribosome-associated protein